MRTQVGKQVLWEHLRAPAVFDETIAFTEVAPQACHLGHRAGLDPSRAPMHGVDTEVHGRRGFRGGGPVRFDGMCRGLFPPDTSAKSGVLEEGSASILPRASQAWLQHGRHAGQEHRHGILAG